MTEIHSRIFSVSQRLFALRGYAGVSISDIATGAEIAKSTVLHHYPNKQKLYEAIVTESQKAFAGLTGHIAAETQIDLSERLHALLSWMLAEPLHAKLLNRVFMDNPRAAAMAARKYWKPLLESLLAAAGLPADDTGARMRILFCINAIFQIAFSIELQMLLCGEKTSAENLAERFRPAIAALAADLDISATASAGKRATPV